MKLTLLWLLAIPFALSGIVALRVRSYTLGTVLVWLVFLGLAAYGLFYKKINLVCQKGIGLVLKYCVWAGLAVLCALFIFVAVSGYTNTATCTEQVIIVLGAGVKGETIGGVLFKRLQATLKAWQQNPNALIVVAGGQGPQEDIPEALAMQRYLLAKGVPESQIIMEDKSTSTEENLVFSKEILAGKGIGANAEIAVVTNAFHCYRATGYAKKAGFENVRTIPAGIDPISILPSYLREEFAIVYYWVFKQ